MKLLSVQLARALWFIDIGEVNPRGKNVFVDLIPELIKTYGFKTFPREGENFDEGMKLALGTFRSSADDSLQVNMTIYSDGIGADTFSCTKDSEEFLEQVSQLIVAMGYTYHPSMIRRKGYLSRIVVRCSARLSSLNSRLDGFAKRISEVTGDGVAYGCGAIEFWADQTLANKPANFSFQKQTGDAFDDDRFWTQAGLSTDKHLELLDELEEILGSGGS